MQLTLEQPTEAQLAQAELSHADFSELIGRQLAEGMSPAIVLTGLTTAVIDFLLKNIGPASTVAWFYSRFAQVAQILKSDAEREALALKKGDCE